MRIRVPLHYRNGFLGKRMADYSDEVIVDASALVFPCDPGKIRCRRFIPLAFCVFTIAACGDTETMDTPHFHDVGPPTSAPLLFLFEDEDRQVLAAIRFRAFSNNGHRETVSG